MPSLAPTMHIRSAGRAVPLTALEAAMATAAPGDWMLMQNETSAQVEAVALAKARGVKVAYSAAPFEAEAVRKVLADLAIHEPEAFAAIVAQAKAAVAA